MRQIVIGCDEEKVAAIEFICGLAETFSSCELLTVDSSIVHQDCVLYSAKDGFYAMPLWKNIASISPVSWWNDYCTNQELSKIAVRLLKLPPTTAAVEQFFSCYSNIHTAKRNQLTNDRASKLIFISHNIQRTTGQQSKHSSQATHTSLTSDSKKSVHVSIAEEAIEIESSSDE